MSVIATFMDFSLNILEDLVPGFIILLDKISVYIPLNKYNIFYYFLWVVRFVTFTYIFVRMAYLLFAKNKYTYRDYVPIRLVLSVINMVLAFFILTKFKDTLKLITTSSSPELIERVDELVNKAGSTPTQIVNTILKDVDLATGTKSTN